MRSGSGSGSNSGSGSPTWAVIAGGGTAGHVVPGLAVAGALVGRGHDPSTIHFLGSRRGIEARLVPAAGFGLTELRGRGLPRRLSVEAVRAVGDAAIAAVQAVSLLRRLRPAVVVALGGHASVAGVAAATLLRVPVVVMEQNAVPGRTNRMAARVARACAVSFPGTDLPKATVTGNPVRSEILAVGRSPENRAAAKAELGVAGNRKLLVVTGGSQGARRINRAVAGALDSWWGRDDLAVRHVVGNRDWDQVASSHRGDSADVGAKLLYLPVPYDDRINLLLAAADLMVGRGGASTVSELSAVGVPSILVPLPGAPGDHQTANARVLADAGAAVLIPDHELDAARLVEEVDRLLADHDRLQAMGRAAATCGRRDAAEAVAALVERVAERS